MGHILKKIGGGLLVGGLALDLLTDQGLINPNVGPMAENIIEDFPYLPVALGVPLLAYGYSAVANLDADETSEEDSRGYTVGNLTLGPILLAYGIINTIDDTANATIPLTENIAALSHDIGFGILAGSGLISYGAGQILERRNK